MVSESSGTLGVQNSKQTIDDDGGDENGTFKMFHCQEAHICPPGW